MNLSAKILVIFAIICMALGSCPVEKQQNGFYVPKLPHAVGIPHGGSLPTVKPTTPTDLKDITLTARPVPLTEALSCENFLKSPIVTDLVCPQRVNLSDNSINVIKNTNGGGILQFGALKLVKNYQIYYALQVIGTMTPGGSESRTPILAYWLPHGGFVDIPTIPEEQDPKFVFTSGFKGGSLVADVNNASTIRIRHIISKQENSEIKNKGDEEHGFLTNYGKAGKIIHSDYGIHVNTETCKLIENANGFAFIGFDKEIQHWVITYQGILHNPIINDISFAQRNNWKVNTKFSSATKIVIVDSKIIGTHKDAEKTVENSCYFGKL